MVRFLTRRLVFFLFTLFFTSVLIFALTRVLPGDVARVILGREAGESQIEETRQELGLNDPLIMQYFNWVGDFVTGDWGRTFTSPRQDIQANVLQRTRNSGRLALVTLVMAVPLSIGLGVIAGLTEGKLPDGVISILSLSVASLPEFITGLFLINAVAGARFGNTIRQVTGFWFPRSSAVPASASFGEALPSLWLPAATATLVLIAYVARLTRAGVIEEVKRDYVRTASLKGLTRRTVIVKHVLRNALIPTITVIATSTGWLISGLVVIEFVYGYPGLGSLLISSIENRNLTQIQAIVMVTVTIILVANFVADMLYAVLNPRISLS